MPKGTTWNPGAGWPVKGREPTDRERVQLDLTLSQGVTYVVALDGPRLETLGHRVLERMADGKWHTLADLHQHCGGSEAGISARLRELRNRYGYNVLRRRVRGQERAGLWEYRLGRKEEPQDADANDQAANEPPA